ncbi:hypothetical protein PVAP13_3KG265533 [Panicum virgatum]|uniref:Uncharacterized protein n=1 Tax=Panicum virgatum TaxID=38727 RepID=A0A8T0V0Y8_PANVG|nr:hypothetical protein PVAP13_3KG265533 [Panicum virgatum]
MALPWPCPVCTLKDMAQFRTLLAPLAPQGCYTHTSSFCRTPCGQPLNRCATPLTCSPCRRRVPPLPCSGPCFAPPPTHRAAADRERSHFARELARKPHLDTMPRAQPRRGYAMAMNTLAEPCLHPCRRGAYRPCQTHTRACSALVLPNRTKPCPLCRR